MATQSSARYAPMQVYVAPTTPILPSTAGGDNSRFLLSELATLQAVLASTQNMVPQAAVQAPRMPVDGMQRLSRAPWRPLTGQTVDTWVYFDAPSNSWKAL